jgi:hypothetical protein
MPQNASSARYVPLGTLSETPEKVRCGGTAGGGIVAVTAGSKIAVWKWREPEGSPERGPHWLWGSGGPITAIAIDTEEGGCAGHKVATPAPTPAGGLSLFACVRETKRSCLLDFDLARCQLRRTLLGLSDIVCESKTPIPATACAVASCGTHVAASTTIGELVVWERASGVVVFRVRELQPRPQQATATPGTATAAAAVVAAASAAAASAARGTITYACCLSFVSSILVCGLSSGDVAIYSVTSHSALARLCGTGEAVSAMFASYVGDQLVVRAGYSRGTIATRRFPMMVETGGGAATSTSTPVVVATPSQIAELSKKTKKVMVKKVVKRKKTRVAMCKLCGKVSTEYGRCGRCKKETYCSRECQVKDWTRHKLVCEPKELDQFHSRPTI